MEKVFGFLFTLQLFTHHVFAQQDTYRAAVLEYAPKLIGATPADHIRENTREHILHMEQAARQGAQIIVFPEDGLTGWEISFDELDQVSTSVPDPADRISPCDLHRPSPPGYSNYSKFLVDLSCAARQNRIYAVVNLKEWRQEEHTDKKIYYNTNIALDRNGNVIARYRKINLFGEEYHVPGNSTDALSIFKTDFGVTFGMFICFDIMFKTPAIDIIDNPSVTDIVFSSAWFSELPFYEANSVHHGFAKSNGVNLLAAGTNDPAVTMGGSGIYLADGRIVETYVSGARGSKLIIQNVPKLSTRKHLSNACQSASPTPFQYQTSDISSFNTKISDLTHYTFKPLNLDNSEISETICSGRSYCCSFNITLYKGASPNYVYKLVAFHGVKKFATKTVGIRNCGLVACLNDKDESCGGRHAEPPTVTFESISIKGTFANRHAHDQPATLKFDLKPSTEYMYCLSTSNNKVEISLKTTKPHESLLTFGLAGRIFDNDDKPEGPINGASFKKMEVYIVLFISMFVFLQED